MRKIKFIKRYPYKALFIGGALLWIIETGLFGWNMTAQSVLEYILDFVSVLMMFWGALGDIARQLYVIKIDNPPKGFKIKTDLGIVGPVFEDKKIPKEK
jgi:hypothetical protein